MIFREVFLAVIKYYEGWPGNFQEFFAVKIVRVDHALKHGGHINQVSQWHIVTDGGLMLCQHDERILHYKGDIVLEYAEYHILEGNNFDICLRTVVCVK